MKLIFVHGRAQGEFEEKDLKETWIKTLKEGLAKSGLDLPISEDDIHFPYYGKLLDKLVIEYNKPVEQIIKKGNDSNSNDARFFHDFLEEVADNANVSTQEIEDEDDNEIKEKGPLNWEWVQCILKAIDKKSSWSVASLKKFTYDVFLYLTIPAIKDEINDVIKKVLAEDEPCVVVAHSLGTVVSYNVLREMPSLTACKFITVGSPLGISAIKKYLKTPIKMPECVQNGWYNAYDERDVVALNALDKRIFNISPSIINNNSVKNQTYNRHGIIGYLNDKEVAKEIYDALTNGCS